MLSHLLYKACDFTCPQPDTQASGYALSVRGAMTSVDSTTSVRHVAREVGASGCAGSLEKVHGAGHNPGVIATPSSVLRCVGVFGELATSGCRRRTASRPGAVWEAAAVCARLPASSEPQTSHSSKPSPACRQPSASAKCCCVLARLISPLFAALQLRRARCDSPARSRTHRVSCACGSSFQPCRAADQHRVRYCFRPPTTTTPNTVMARGKRC